MSWVIVAVAAGIVLAGLAWLRRQVARERQAFARLCDAVGAVPAGLEATGDHEGVPYRLSYGSDAEAAGALRITLACPSEGRWSVRPISDIEMDRQPAIETGDVDFDRAGVLAADRPEEAAAFFADGARRRAARKLLELGFTAVRLDGRVLEAVWSGFDLRDPPSPTAIVGGLGHLVTLARGVPGFPFFTRSFAGYGRRTQRLVVAVVPATLFLAGSAGSAWGLLNYPPIDAVALLVASLVGSLPACLVHTGFTWRVLRGTPRAERKLTTMLLWSFAGFVLAGLGATAVINGALDTSPPAVHSVRTIQKANLIPFHVPAHVVTVESWHRADALLTMRVSADVYQRIEPGTSRLLVATRRGRLGFEWVIRVVPVGGRPR